MTIAPAIPQRSPIRVRVDQDFEPGYLFDVFGLSFGEMAVVAIVMLVVLGPRELPNMMRSLGRGLAKLRRMSTELRKQSGIDEIIREEGLQEELQALRALRNMSGTGALESFLENASRSKQAALVAAALASDEGAPALERPPIELEGTTPDPLVEYPEIGCDAYGACYQASGADEAALAPKSENAP
jgi:sec-independent protein translocase protein TatB